MTMTNRNHTLTNEDYSIEKRDYDGKYSLLVNMSLVRLGETDKELVKSGVAVDLRRWVTAHVGTEQSCKTYLDKNMTYLTKMNTTYEFRG